jgi:glutamate synthase domain-containing protein 3
MNSLRENSTNGMGGKLDAFRTLSSLLDNLHRIPGGQNGRIHAEAESTLFSILREFQRISEPSESEMVLIDSTTISELRSPRGKEEALLLDVSGFDAEGKNSASLAIVAAYRKGWKRVISFDWRGQRFCGAGLGEHSEGFRLDVYGNPGDYLGSGLDGAEVYVHAAAQDQVAQIMKSGKLVIYGDVGQTFMYAAKGGEVYVLGNAAGRPLINAVGRPRVVINGTCLDYLAESFMAGDPLKGGGFVVVNGISFDDGRMRTLDPPYPGGNLFSLASGGAIYVRDLAHKLGADQLNGGQLAPVSERDWQLILPYLQENERMFGVKIEELLSNGSPLTDPSKVYRKIEPTPLKVLAVSHKRQ